MMAGAALLVGAGAAQAITLDFNRALMDADSTNAVYGELVEQTTIDFRRVARADGVRIDARVTATAHSNTAFGGGTTSGSGTGANSGFIPNYNTVNGTREPNDDLGLLFGGLGSAGDVAGLTISVQLFVGGRGIPSFTDPYTAASLEFMIYDVDGEPSQDEQLRAYKTDGLKSYRVGTTPQALSAFDEGNSILFSGPGQNFSELDPSGAAILYYEETSGFTLDFIATKNSGSGTNAVFSAIDGDLSLAALGLFGDPVQVELPPHGVPLPASAWFFLSLILFPVLRWARRA